MEPAPVQPDPEPEPQPPPRCVPTQDGNCVSAEDFQTETESLAAEYREHVNFENQWGLSHINAAGAYGHVSQIKGEDAAPGVVTPSPGTARRPIPSSCSCPAGAGILTAVDLTSARIELDDGSGRGAGRRARCWPRR